MPEQHSGAETVPPPFAAPQISVPKGGGAIRGIGEKFAANAATGTGALTIPLPATPGRNGFGPSLTVAYNSGSGNGPFGIGWSLSAAAITRKTEKGTPRYFDAAESDVFILSGSEDLVPALERTLHGRWHAVEEERDGYIVKQYRPRIEGPFARIEKWTSACDGAVHWRTLSKENVLTVFGDTDDSRIADPGAPLHVFSWLASRSYDDRGNAIRYEYAREGDDGVDTSSASERHHTRTANRYLKRVFYGNRRPLRAPHAPAPDDVEWLFELVFDYGDEGYTREEADERGRVHVRLQPTRERPARRDPFSTYRAGFEIRTYRLCRRVLMYHRFPGELGTPRCLVRSIGLEYAERPFGSFLTRVVQSGYRRVAEGRYLEKSLPAIELSYSASPLADAHPGNYEVQEADSGIVTSIPAGLAADVQWVDLDGEGISGVLAEPEGGWFYQRNLGNGRFAAPQLVAARPSFAGLTGGAQQFLDIDGDGQIEVVSFKGPAPGYYERTSDARFAAFRPFRSLPSRNLSDPSLRFADITGDGLADIVITADDAITWYRSEGGDGFAPGGQVPLALDEERGPRVMFADPAQSVFLADMSGDGAPDIVRIRNGEVCYWPNLGYGRFGAKVSMDRAPRFDGPDRFVPGRIRLADTDGSGTTDIVYFGAEGVTIFLNESGNGWSEPRVLRDLPPLTPQHSASVIDLLGRGTACLAWSSPLPADSRRPLLYVDLMRGQKPHLLTRIVNNLGSETEIQYASSTRFYLADNASGDPWVTRLPFPVHVVERIDTFDRVSRNRFVTRYSYHHGFYDGYEREFRGFGRVDQFDTEEIGALGDTGATNIDAASSVAPVLTRTWFHTGVFIRGGQVSTHLAREYWSDSADAPLLDDTVLPAGLTAEEAREACRALKGSTLRQEVYALDGTGESSRPYSVTESNLGLRLIQPRGPNRHAVLFSHAREQVSVVYERTLVSRTAHTLTLEVDAYGNILRSVAVAYGRHATVHDFQRRTLLTLTENDYTNAVESPDDHRTPLPAEQRLFELRGLSPDGGGTTLFRFSEMARNVRRLADGRHDIPFDDWRGDDGRVGRRLLKRTQTRYRANDLHDLLPLGRLQSMALPGENHRLAAPPRSLRDKIDGHELPLQAEGGYASLGRDGGWWAPSGRVFYSREPDADPASELRDAEAHFFLPRRYVDPFGNATIVVFDEHDLVPVETIDAAGNVTRAEIDYRVVAPRRQIDANGNRSEVAFDALGLVAGTAIQGKEGEALGDSLEGFDPDLDAATVRAFFDDPRGAATGVLERASTRVLYDVDRYARSGEPACAATIARETHDSDLGPGQQTRTQVRITFSDGFEREIQTKLQAEAGPLTPNGDTVGPRWIGTGWTIFNNKGKPVRKYEPFFSATADFELAAIVGVSPILLYDPLGRVIATLHPEHTFEKVVFGPWEQVKWDASDTVLLSPADDPDVGDLASRLPDSDYLPTWYAARIGGERGEADRRAAQGAARHADTPSTIHLDPLGRAVLTVVDNGRDDEGRRRLYPSLAILDVEGHTRDVVDALGRSVMRYDYDMAERRVHQASMDAGERWTLNDISGKPIRGWNSRRFVVRTEYDVLRRPLRRHVRGDDSGEVLFEQTIYGDSAASGLTEDRQRAANLRGRMFRHFDTAGLTTADRYDFKGNLAETSRQFASDYRRAPDWSASPALDLRRFEARTTYDALNRPLTNTTPDGSVFRPAYNDAALIERIDVALRPADPAAPVWAPFIRNIDYNARGQRTRLDYGNGVATALEYDPATFLIVRRLSTRPHDGATLPSQIFVDAASVQDLHYHYDSSGNVAEVFDRALRTVFHDNQKIDAACRYTYDALYRLTAATGREHVGQSAFRLAPEDGDYRGYPFAGASALADPQSLEPFVERYEYDPVGNFLAAAHRSAHNSWTRRYVYEEESLLEQDRHSNRLTRTETGAPGRSSPETYLYDADGSVVKMPHLPTMRWDFMDRLTATSPQVVNTGSPETTYYVYDGTGARVRKVTERGGGTRTSDQLYVGVFEVFHEFAADGDEVVLERETLHVMDGSERVAIVETRTIDRDDPALSVAPRQQFQLVNHLGSSTIELDEGAGMISYEEYAPYGTTVFQAGRSASEVRLKRYRYTGKERDDENGFTYHGARYYAPWLGRWTSADPSGLEDGPCVYSYVSNNPMRLVDASGAAGAPPGALGHVAPWIEQINPRRLFGTIVTEAEHVIPRGVLKQILYNPATKETEYTLWRYLKDPTVVVERATALMKTFPSRGIATADNARTAAAKAIVAAGKPGQGVSLGREIEQAIDTTKQAIAATGSIVKEGQFGEALLGQVGNLFAADRLADTAQKLKAFDEAMNVAKGTESAATALKSVPKVGPIGTGLAVIGLVLTVGVSSAQAATRPTATTTLDKIETVTEDVRGVVDVGGAVMSLHPTGGLIVGVATATTLVAEKGIQVTGGDDRIVQNAKAVEDFAKAHGATEGQAQVAGAVTAAASGIAEGIGVISDISMGPLGWADLAYKAYKSRK